jgi:threonylcarbamoyladenosine tRNA methylthiotransferase MtaB
MRRGLTADRYRRLARLALNANPRLHLATDLIAGFPGETEPEHEETLRLVEELPFATLHVFPFSPRSGTRGAELQRDLAVPRAVVTRRAAALRRLGEVKERLFRRSADGTEADTVALRGGRGLTDHYLDVVWTGPAPAPGARLRARLALRVDGELEARPAIGPSPR